MITARFNSACAETGKLLRKGDEILYAYGKAYHVDSVHGQEYLKKNCRVEHSEFNLDSMIEEQLMQKGY
jgi:hypothetical protein